MSKHETKAAYAKAATVIPETVRFHDSVGRDDIYIGQTTNDEAVMGIIAGLRRSAPPEVRQWMLNRMISNLTGRCPLCDSCVDAAEEMRGEIKHEDDCILIGRPDFVARWMR